MNEHTAFDTMTTAALRDLDPAPTTVLTDEELGRADATFARILATPSHVRSQKSPIGRDRAGGDCLCRWVWSAPPVPPSSHCCWGEAPPSRRGRRSPNHSRPRP